MTEGEDETPANDGLTGSPLRPVQRAARILTVW